MDSPESSMEPPEKRPKPSTSSSGTSNDELTTTVQKDKPKELQKPEGSRNYPSGTLLVNCKQRGNVILKYITSVPWEFVEIVPDYIMGRTSCALFLSLRYHQLNPDYIHTRIKLLGKSFALRVLLVQVDIPEPHHSLKNLTRICLLADLTLMLAWSAEDAGKMLETYKIYENKPPDMIMERSETAPYHKVVSALTTIRSVNKTDAVTLLSTFGTVEAIVKAPEGRLGVLPGFGKQKAQRLYKTLHEPFLKN